MAIVEMSGKNIKQDKSIADIKPVEPLVRPNTTWYNPTLCNRADHRCPYLEMDDVAQVARCHKPYSEDCLGKSMLVQMMLLREHYLKVTKALDDIDIGLTADLDSCAKVQPSKKRFISRIKKPIKSRRS